MLQQQDNGGQTFGLMMTKLECKMNSGKKEQQDELKRLVDEYLKNGGEIEQVPSGVSGNQFKFHGHRTFKGKAHLHNLSPKEGFAKHRIYLTQKK